MLKTNNNTLRVDKLVSFIQHDLPGLKDGKYRLKMSQQVLNGTTVLSAPLSIDYHFAVTSDRFSLSNPANSVYSVFPANNASGKYDSVLPSVVFSKTSFPWSRSPMENNRYGEPIPAGQTTDRDEPTWLTILLLDETDLARYVTGFPDFTLTPRTRTVADLFPSAVVAESDLGDHYSYFENTRNKQISAAGLLDPGQQLSDRILCLDLPVPLFRSIAPATDDLKYMAHIRKVSLVNKPTMPGISDIGEPEGSFSIVFGNRLPGSKRKTYAYLVSLENMESFLPSSPASIDANKKVRLAVLKNWSFYSTGSNATFADQMKRLNGTGIAEGDINADLHLNTTLALDIPPGSIDRVSDAIQMGYVPLKHHLRSAGKSTAGAKPEMDATVSWYRGPLCPCRVSTGRINLPVVSPDQASIFDPTTGMFDVSYACAWTLGRQMALQDKKFSTRLYQWKIQIKNNIQNAMEKEHIQRLFSNVLTKTSPYLQAKNSRKRPESFIKQVVFSLKEKKG